MRYHERADGELLELAQSGWSPAFAVLVHRHTPALLAAFGDDPDPIERVTDVFVRAMRHLPEQDPTAPVAPWLFALAGRPVPEVAPAVPEETLDAVWRELAPRWPDGKLSRAPRRPSAGKVGTVLGALALGVLVPVVVLGMPTSSEPDSVESVRAYPLEEDPEEDTGPVDPPAFDFPDVGAGEPEPAPTEPVETTPLAPTEPAPAPAAPVEPPPPPPEVVEDPDPEPVEQVEPVEPPPATDDGTDDDGTATDGSDDGSAGSDDGTDDGDVLPIGGGTP